METTKKEYERYLNEMGVPKSDDVEYGGRCRSKDYGTWLRRNDPIAFNVGYYEWVRFLILTARLQCNNSSKKR